jgi:pyruvate carboxylase
LRLLNHPSFVENAFVWTTFIDDTPSLLKGIENSNRGQKLLRYLANLVVNGPSIKGQVGLPLLQQDVEIPSLEGLSTVAAMTPAKSGWRGIFLDKGPKEFAREVRAHKGLLIMDTTMRDGE